MNPASVFTVTSGSGVSGQQREEKDQGKKRSILLEFSLELSLSLLVKKRINIVQGGVSYLS